MYLKLIHVAYYTSNYTLTGDKSGFILWVIFKDLNRPTRRHIWQFVGNFWSAVLVQKTLI